MNLIERLKSRKGNGVHENINCPMTGVRWNINDVSGFKRDFFILCGILEVGKRAQVTLASTPIKSIHIWVHDKVELILRLSTTNRRRRVIVGFRVSRCHIHNTAVDTVDSIRIILYFCVAMPSRQSPKECTRFGIATTGHISHVA